MSEVEIFSTHSHTLTLSQIVVPDELDRIDRTAEDKFGRACGVRVLASYFLIPALKTECSGEGLCSLPLTLTRKENYVTDELGTMDRAAED